MKREELMKKRRMWRKKRTSEFFFCVRSNLLCYFRLFHTLHLFPVPQAKTIPIHWLLEFSELFPIIDFFIE